MKTDRFIPTNSSPTHHETTWSHSLAGPGFAELFSKQNEKYNNLVERESYYRVWQNGNKAINKHFGGALHP